MKELSIEDKAQRYDEAIKFAYNKHRFSSNLSEIKLIEELFPELKEDEREIPISEQKSAEEYNITGIGSKNAQGKLGEMIKRKLEIEKQCEQKPAWNEEDEEIIDYLIDYLESELDSSYTDLDKETFTKEINWLKSLKDRVQPQNTWKPSDEQMKALKYVVNLMASSESPTENDYYYNVFKDLREQLKKLRGK